MWNCDIFRGRFCHLWNQTARKNHRKEKKYWIQWQNSLKCGPSKDYTNPKKSQGRCQNSQERGFWLISIPRRLDFRSKHRICMKNLRACLVIHFHAKSLPTPSLGPRGNALASFGNTSEICVRCLPCVSTSLQCSISTEVIQMCHMFLHGNALQTCLLCHICLCKHARIYPFKNLQNRGFRRFGLWDPWASSSQDRWGMNCSCTKDQSEWACLNRLNQGDEIKFRINPMKWTFFFLPLFVNYKCLIKTNGLGLRPTYSGPTKVQ